MTTGTSRAGAETRILDLVHDWEKALRAKDLDRLMSHYAQDVHVFGIAGELEYTGWDAHRRHWEEKFKQYDGPIDYQMRELRITTSGDIAYGHCVNRIADADDEKGSNWVRVTVCYRREGDRWLVTHEHVSVPFDMKTGYAMMDLKPES